MNDVFKRVNVTILESQHERLNDLGLNVSGLLRDLLGDYLSDNVINLSVSAETRELYDRVVANTGCSDEDLELPLRTALAEMLVQKIEDMRALHANLLSAEKT